MKRLLVILTLSLAVSIYSVSGQIYAKINALYALVGVINPQVEAGIAPHSTMVIDLTVSPWKSVNSRHFLFGMMNAEYRYYIKGATNGFYAAANIGGVGFNINKPYFFKYGNIINFNSRYGKGFGFILGACLGYQHQISERWSVDAFAGFGYMHSWYNGYLPDGTIVMNPHGHEHYDKPDPFNISAEWMPFKAGIAIGYKIFGKRD